jgi:hypothetical protein|tara:strand:- start:66 stop:416 length:351 start_codon:yes stop_codon:yes gene_type:complete
MSSESAREYAAGIAEGLPTWKDHPELADVEDSEKPWQWLEGTLDVERTYNSENELISVRVLIAYGGPTCWVVFDGGPIADVQAAWWSPIETVRTRGSEQIQELAELVFELSPQAPA